MKVFAHRGASAYAPQNTMPAFKKALELESDGIELDVQLSSDGVPMVIHDFYVDACTDGSGLVGAHSYNELRGLDAGSSFSSDFRGEKIPTLEEVLALVPADVCLNIEIKALSPFKENTSELVWELLNQEKLTKKRNVIISSFNHLSLQQMRQLDDEIKIGLLFGSHLLNPIDYALSTGIKPTSMHPEVSYINEDLILGAHKQGWEVICYTVNDLAIVNLIKEFGVDGFFGNYPDILNKDFKI